MSKNLLEVKDLSVSYGGIRAVKAGAFAGSTGLQNLYWRIDDAYTGEVDTELYVGTNNFEGLSIQAVEVK